jgi:hypothetical protein
MQKNKSETLLYYSTCIEKFSRIDIMYIVNVYLLFVLVSLFSLPHIVFDHFDGAFMCVHVLCFFGGN